MSLYGEINELWLHLYRCIVLTASRRKVVCRQITTPMLVAVLAWALTGCLILAEERSIGPKLVCKEPTLDFGHVSNTGRVFRAFVVRNTGDADLTLFHARSGCAVCANVTVDPNRVVPGGTALITVDINICGRFGEISRAVSIETNDPDQSILRLCLKGVAYCSKPTQDIYVVPRMLSLSRMRSVDLRRTVAVRSRSRARFYIDSIAVPFKGVGYEVKDYGKDEGLVVVFTGSLSDVKLDDGEVVFNLKGMDQKDVRLPVLIVN